MNKCKWGLQGYTNFYIWTLLSETNLFIAIFVHAYCCSGTRLSLDAIKRAVQPIVRRKVDEVLRERRSPVFRVNIVLAIPNVLIQPTVDEVQAAINKSVQIILKMTESFPRWKHFVALQEHQQKVCYSHATTVIKCQIELAICAEASQLSTAFIRMVFIKNLISLPWRLFEGGIYSNKYGICTRVIHLGVFRARVTETNYLCRYFRDTARYSDVWYLYIKLFCCYIISHQEGGYKRNFVIDVSYFKPPLSVVCSLWVVPNFQLMWSVLVFSFIWFLSLCYIGLGYNCQNNKHYLFNRTIFRNVELIVTHSSTVSTCVFVCTPIASAAERDSNSNNNCTKTGLMHIPLPRNFVTDVAVITNLFHLVLERIVM